jgi:hypothetical protein
MVFLGSLCRETAENAIKNNRREKTEGKKFFFSLNFFGFSPKSFCGVFELLMQRNGQKRDKKIIDGKRRKEKTFFFSQLFWPKAFDMDFLQKVFYGVFELPLLRNAQKRHKKNKKKYLPTPFASARLSGR